MTRAQPPAALIIIDVQKGFDDPVWGERNNPGCETNIVTLLGHWRASGWPVVFVRHDSIAPGSPLAPGQPGNEFKAELTGAPDLLVTKQVNSAFLGTPDLAAWLRASGVHAVVVCGITTNHCCETTARMAGNLGFDTTFVLDATHTFDRQDLTGVAIAADELARVTAANLQDEFAEVRTTAQIVAD